VPVHPRDVSVVVQGPVAAETPAVLASVRALVPEAELVLSTWQGASTTGLDVDVLLHSVDPGSTEYWQGNDRRVNTNRMIRSTRAGVEAATRPWVLKLRQDTPVLSRAFLSWADHPAPRTDELRVFGQRVLTTSIASRGAARNPSFLFHPSDCVHFGRAEDLRHLWGADEVDEVANATYWTRGPGSAPGHPLNPGSPGPALWNEQTLWLSALRRAGHDITYPYYGHLSEGLTRMSDVSLVNNFLVLEPWQMGVGMPGLIGLARLSGVGGYIWHEDWLQLVEQLLVA
jgi:hypothetical protein